jgi:DNA-binding YbaB/EbfC family protein
MFDQLKDLYNLRKQAAELQKQLESERISSDSNNGLVTITINGSHQLLDLTINKELAETNKEQLSGAIKDAYNQAAENLKSLLAEKFKGMM